MPITKDLIENYIKKLNVSNTKSIHLNAHVGKSATKLDIAELEIVSPGFIETFLDALLREDKAFSIKFKIGKQESFEIYKEQFEDGTPEDQIKKKFDNICNRVIKRLETINDKCVDIFQETGINTFGFGMPMIGRKEGPGKYIYAPLFTWNLTLKKITKEANTYEIIKQEDFPGEVNKPLLSYIENTDKITIEEPEINDWITEDLAIEYIDKFLSYFEKSENTEDRFYDMELQIEDNNEFKKQFSDNIKVFISGVFGIYALQKESIKAATEEMKENFEELFEENENIDLEYKHSFGAKESDPSQTKILHTVCKDSSDMIIMGPPGTGKSHTITSILTNALQNNQKCLVICEKRTALEVLAQNLDGLDLKDSYVLIEDANKDRKTVVNSVRDFADNNQIRSINPLNYELNLSELTTCINDINGVHNKLDEEVLNGNSWKQIAGTIIGLEDRIKDKELINKIKEYLETYKSINTDSAYKNLSKDFIDGANIYKKDATKYSKILSAFVNSGEGSIGEQFEVFQNTKKKINKKYIDCKLLLENIKSERKDLGEKISNYKENMDIRLNETINDLKIESDNFEKILKNETKNKYQNIKTIISGLEQIVKDIVNLKIDAENCNEETIELFESNFNKLEEKIRDLKQEVNEINNQNIRLRDEIIEINNKINNGIKAYKPAFIFNERPGFLGSISFSKETREKNKLIKEIFYRFDNYINEYSKIYRIIKLEGSMKINKINSVSALINKHQEKLAPLFQGLDEIQSMTPDVKELKKSIIEYSSDLNNVFDELNYLSTALGYELKKGSFTEIEESLETVKENIIPCEMDFKLFNDTYEWASYCNNKTEKFLELLKGFYLIPNKERRTYFTFGFLSKLLDNKYDYQLDGITDSKYEDLEEAEKAFNNDQIRKIKYEIQNAKFSALNTFKDKHGNLVNTYSIRGTKSNGKKTLKQIVNTDFNFFSTFFPIILTNPSTCAQLFEMKKNLFDIVIFDEASQLRIEDVMQCLIRGKRRIVCGDDKQMPPSDYFTSDITIEGDNLVYENADDEKISEEIKTLELSNCESLLEYADIMNYHSDMLKIHYRSSHPYLIDFSNNAYYQGQLHPFPATREYIPIKFIPVNDAIYNKGENKKEAEYVIEVLRECLEYYGVDDFPSIGIATFNIKQRKTILDEIAKLQLKKDHFAQQLNNLNPENFFIKNLDAIQGDERDIIIVSTTFGYNESKRFLQNFGPINTSKGFRFLNVMITRAKKQLIVVSSIPENYYSKFEDEMKERGGAYGKAGFYAWLSYVKAISDKNNDAREHILKVLNIYNPNENKNNKPLINGFTDTPFEDTIIGIIKKQFPNSKIEKGKYEAGLQIDIAITNKEGKKTAIECDGNKMGEPEVSYSRDIYREKWITKKCGYDFYRVWSFDWLKDRKKQEENLINYLKENGYS